MPNVAVHGVGFAFGLEPPAPTLPRASPRTTSVFAHLCRGIKQNMAEVFGIVAGGVGIAAAFTTCVDCFDYIQVGRHFKRDYQTEMLKLECARYRLTTWGQAVNIYSTHQVSFTDASGDRLRLAKDLLFQILKLFEDARKVSERYAPSISTVYLSGPPRADIDLVTDALGEKLKKLAIRRREGTSLLKKATWALHHRTEFKDLIDGITDLIDKLEGLHQTRNERLELVDRDMEELRDEQGLERVADAACGVDPLLQTAAENCVIDGHRFTNIQIAGEGKVLNGDSFSDNWTGSSTRSYNAYKDIRVKGRSKVLNGNKYGGKDFFDD